MRKTYNIGDLVRIREEELIGSKYGTIHNKYRSLSTGKPVYSVLVTGEGKDMISFGKPLCITLDHDDLFKPEA
jgi:hypothetical protein